MKKRTIRPQKNTVSELLFAAFTGFVLVGGIFAFLKTQNTTCANSKSCVKNLQAVAENQAVGYFEGQAIVPPAIDLTAPLDSSRVLGASTMSGDKHIFVDLSTQTLYAYQGSTLIMQTLISSGKWNATPPGDYHIWVKLRSTRMSGGEGADAYDLPNVPFTMFFYNDKVGKGEGFSLHGAYWHDNFGHMMSHGCVNMRSVDAEEIYHWADPPTQSPTTYATAQNPGTLVSICTQVQMNSGDVPTCIE